MWDISSVTCADFSVQIDFPRNKNKTSFWKEYQIKRQMKSVGTFFKRALSKDIDEIDITANSFKDFFKKEILKQVKTLPPVLN